MEKRLQIEPPRFGNGHLVPFFFTELEPGKVIKVKSDFPTYGEVKKDSFNRLWYKT